MSGKCSSIRLGETVFPLWAASKDMYTSSSAKYSKFKLSHADFAEHLLRFHIENSCSLCYGDAYSGKYRNIGVQTEKAVTEDGHEQQAEEIHYRKKTPTDNSSKLHFDHAYFTIDPKRLKNNKKPSRKRCLSLSQFQDFQRDENDGEREDIGDDDDADTLTASERGSDEDMNLFPVSLAKFGCKERDMGPCAAGKSATKREETRVQKQRDSVEGIISKIKQKMMGEEVETVRDDAAATGSQGQRSEDSGYMDGVISKMKMGIIGEEDEEDFITALYTMAAGNDVQCLEEMIDQPRSYPVQGIVTTIKQQVGVENVDAPSKSETSDAGDGPQVTTQQHNKNCYNTTELKCEDDTCGEAKEGRVEKKQSRTMRAPNSSTILPKIDKKRVMKTQRILKRKAKKKALETKRTRKKPITRIPEKRIYRPHPRLDVQLAKLPKTYECKMCFVHLPEADDMRSHYAEAHPKDISDTTPGGDRYQMIDVVTSRSFFPVLELKQIATELRQCKECKEYVANIKVHRRIHWVKKFICDICGKGFVFKSILRKHQVYHNAQWRLLKSHKCGTCGKAYIDKTSLNAHILSSHNQGEKCFICEQCGKQFARKKSLTVHRDTHLKEKPFRCFECGRGFTQKNNMKLHMRTHTGVKPYRCSSCSKDFRHKVSLKTHQKKVHGIDWWKEREREISDPELLHKEPSFMQPLSLQEQAYTRP